MFSFLIWPIYGLVLCLLFSSVHLTVWLKPHACSYVPTDDRERWSHWVLLPLKSISFLVYGFLVVWLKYTENFLDSFLIVVFSSLLSPLNGCSKTVSTGIPLSQNTKDGFPFFFPFTRYLLILGQHFLLALSLSYHHPLWSLPHVRYQSV